MTNINQIISSIAVITVLLGALAGSAVAQTNSPKFDRVTVTIKDAVKCKRCSGRGYTNGRSGDTNHRAQIYVEIRKNYYGVPCTGCGGKRGKSKKKGTGKRPIKFDYLVPRGSTKVDGKSQGNTTVVIKPAKLTRPKSKTK